MNSTSVLAWRTLIAIALRTGAALALVSSCARDASVSTSDELALTAAPECQTYLTEREACWSHVLSDKPLADRYAATLRTSLLSSLAKEGPDPMNTRCRTMREQLKLTCK